MIFTAPKLQGLYVLVESNVLEIISAYRQDSQKKHEAGGTLMGYRSGEHLHVLDATVPMPLDRRSRISFERLDPGHQLAATRAWEESQGRIDYLGEWHTHPQLNPSPSEVDYREWEKLCSALDKPLVFIIVGERAKIVATYHVNRKAIPLTGGE
jgi:integrative and conjugative element protein (TIGR02256 family)